MAVQATPLRADVALDARPLPPPEVVEVLELQDSTLELPRMSAEEMASAVAAIMTAFHAESSHMIADRLSTTLGDFVSAPQRNLVNFSVQFAALLHRELCDYMYRELEASFGQFLINAPSTMLRLVLEHLQVWYHRPLRRNL